ncbi:hypothetical protein BURKHO8Y_210520 [Burkholderia sp. 8Y]|nr:hypothetical protein BURKHO8Y_210520 [Burkholderia sp. 8Y]
MNCVVRMLRERLKMRTRHRRERHLFERDGAELDQLRPEQIAALHLPQIARLHERTHEPVRGAARRAERRAERPQIACAVGGGFENREAAQQRLRAGLLGRDIDERARQRDGVGVAAAGVLRAGVVGGEAAFRVGVLEFGHIDRSAMRVMRGAKDGAGFAREADESCGATRERGQAIECMTCLRFVLVAQAWPLCAVPSGGIVESLDGL